MFASIMSRDRAQTRRVNETAKAVLDAEERKLQRELKREEEKRQREQEGGEGDKAKVNYFDVAEGIKEESGGGGNGGAKKATTKDLVKKKVKKQKGDDGKKN